MQYPASTDCVVYHLVRSRHLGLLSRASEKLQAALQSELAIASSGLPTTLKVYKEVLLPFLSEYVPYISDRIQVPRTLPSSLLVNLQVSPTAAALGQSMDNLLECSDLSFSRKESRSPVRSVCHVLRTAAHCRQWNECEGVP